MADCPNEPKCPHGLMMHDPAEPRPVCIFIDCRCGDPDFSNVLRCAGWEGGSSNPAKEWAPSGDPLSFSSSAKTLVKCVTRTDGHTSRHTRLSASRCSVTVVSVPARFSQVTSVTAVRGHTR